MGTIKHLINVLFLGALCTSLGLVCGTNVLAPRVAALEAVVNEQLVVVDANGAILGPLQDTLEQKLRFIDWLDSEATVLRVEGLPLLPLRVRRDSLVGTSSTVSFSSSDCTGTPLFEAVMFFPPVLPMTFVVSQGETIFYSDTDESEQVATVGSVLEANQSLCTSEPECCTSVPELDARVVPGFRASLQPFTPPYSVVTRGELAAQ